MTAVAICIAAFAMSAAAQTNTFPASGNVGIGTTAPTSEKLVVAGGVDLQAPASTPIGDGGLGLSFESYGGRIQSFQNEPLILNPLGNNVGIGTTSPGARLQVVGNSNEIQLAVQANGVQNTDSQIFSIQNSLGNVTWFNGSGNLILNNGANGSSSLDAASLISTNSNQSINIHPGGATGVYLANTGNVGIGTTSPAAKLDVAGSINISSAGGGITFPNGGGTQSVAWTGVLCGGDYAESVDVSGQRTNYRPGDVLVIGAESGSDVAKSSEPYSTLVLGVYATKPGVVGRRQTTDAKTSTTEVPMAMVGIVPTRVSAENGAIHRGDLLVTSSTMGYAMKGTDRSRMLGAVIGKALGSLDSGTGVIEVAITLQ